jgi:hypothetical protein
LGFARADPAATLAFGWSSRLERKGIRAYLTAMLRFFDMADHDRLPWRFTALNRSVLARLR